MKKSLMGILTGFALSMLLTAAASAGTVLQMRLAADTPSDDAEKMTYTTHNQMGENVINMLYVQKAVLLDDSMVKSAKVSKDPMGRPTVELTFNDAGKNDLRR